MTKPEQHSAEPDEPNLSLRGLIGWLNEQAERVDARAAQLSNPVETPKPTTVAGAAAIIGELGGVEEARRILNDFKGFLIANSAEAAVRLDFPPESDDPG